jgi:hypothetical protein
MKEIERAPEFSDGAKEELRCVAKPHQIINQKIINQKWQKKSRKIWKGAEPRIDKFWAAVSRNLPLLTCFLGEDPVVTKYFRAEA